MKIVLVNLPWRKGNSWGVRAGSRWPHIKTYPERGYLPFPFFLAYAAALLKREGFDVVLIDALALEIMPGEFYKRVIAEKPDLLLAETSTPSLFNDLEMLSRIPSDIPVAICGPESSIRSSDFISNYKFIRYVLIGEYEFTLLDLVRKLQEGGDLRAVNGLMFRDHDALQQNPPRPLLEDLDILPWPLREGLPMEKYNDTPGGIPLPSVQMWSSRGCPYQCSFCLWPQLMYQRNRYRTRNINSVVDEMEYLVKKCGYKSIYFDDDTTNIGKLRMLAWAQEIKRRDLKVPWAMMARADIMDEEILESLHSAGLYAVKYGVESADQLLVDRIGKSMDVRKVERIVRFTQSLGIKTHLTFSFGLPGETADTIRKTVDFAKELNPDSLQFSIATAFPGTGYYQQLDQQGQIVSRNFSDYDGNLKSMLRTESLSAIDLEKAKREADREWQEHIWKTRSAVPSGGWAVKFRRNFNLAGMRALGHRIGAYVREMNAKCAVHDRFVWFASLWQHMIEKRRSAEIVGRKARKNYLNLLGVFTGSMAFKGPDCVQIDLTNRCNNNCVSCWCNSPLLGNRAYSGAKSLWTLPVNLVKTVIDDLAEMGTGELYFSGGGEPFMHRDLLDIIEYAKAKGIECAINTNFTLVNELVVKRLIEIPVDALTVSVWAATAPTYVLTHPNKDEATFHKIKGTLKMLNSLKGPGGPRIKIYNVISSLNYAEVEQMVDFAEEVGAEQVEFTVVDTIPDATDKLILNSGQRASVVEQCDRILGRTHKVQLLNLESFKRRLQDKGADNAQYDSGLLEKKPCYVGWVFSRIMPNGDVNFCLKAHRIPVGNLYQNTFREIWNSSKQKEFRGKALKHDLKDKFFAGMGNDASCQMGCYKSCDNLGHNDRVCVSIRKLGALRTKFIQCHAAWINLSRKVG